MQTVNRMEWIPVAQDTPPTIPTADGFPSSKEVLVYYTDGGYGIAHVVDQTDGGFGVAFAADYGKDIEWYCTTGDNVTEYVSHWTDLPAAPGTTLVATQTCTTCQGRGSYRPPYSATTEPCPDCAARPSSTASATWQKE